MSTELNDLVSLGTQLDIENVRQFHDKLREHLGADGELRLDASGLETVDFAGVQLLLAFHHAVLARGGALKWVGVSQELAEAATLLGLGAALGFEEEV